VSFEAARRHTAAATVVATSFAPYEFAMPPLSARAFGAPLLSGQVVATVGENKGLKIERVVFVIASWSS
jgi:hypothetical protein